MPGVIPDPTRIVRLVHIDSLETLLRRGGLHAPDHCPADGLPYKSIHRVDVQSSRAARGIGCGPGGAVRDYISFYFGYHSPMLLQLKTGQVSGHDEGQEPILYIASNAQVVHDAGLGYVFSDGHGLARVTRWFDSLGRLEEVDWTTVGKKQWADDAEDNDRQRRKQAEFLIHRFCPWSLIRGIGVLNDAVVGRVEEIMKPFPPEVHKPVRVCRGWYY